MLFMSVRLWFRFQDLQDTGELSQSPSVKVRGSLTPAPGLRLFPQQPVDNRGDVPGCQDVALRSEMDTITRNYLVNQTGILPECILEDAMQVAEPDLPAVDKRASSRSTLCHVLVQVTVDLELLGPAMSVVVEGRAVCTSSMMHA